MASFHPKQADFHQALHSCLPCGLAGFLGGISAVSASIWDQGGLTIEIAHGAPPEWSPTAPSQRDLLLEFFACVCGNRSLERTFEAAPALDGLESSLRLAFPDTPIHLEVEPDEPSWSYTLHMLIGPASSPVVYISLFWSVD